MLLGRRDRNASKLKTNMAMKDGKSGTDNLEGWLKKQGKKKAGGDMKKSLWKKRYFRQTGATTISYFKTPSSKKALGCFDSLSVITIKPTAVASDNFWSFEVNEFFWTGLFYII